MQRHFDEELNELKEQLLTMGGLCEKMIQGSVKALLERNLEHSGDIMTYEDQVNRLHVDIDDHCMRLFAAQAPLASDLRTIIAALKINNDLERIGDQACNISQNTMDLLKAPKQKLTESLGRMAGLASEMVHESLDAFVQQDVSIAESVLTKEVMVDALKDQIFDEQLTEMSKNASTVRRGLDLILIARNLEKVGDHATNIAEDVIFMVKGKDIRHHLGEGGQ
ncbi:MAG: phosphate signaling complex protein PhoU [candidate division FCPU426 bacterium]